MKTLISIVLGLIFIQSTFAQEKGFVRGNIADGVAGGGLYGAKVRVKETPSLAALTDFDGNFSLSLSEGTYNIEIVYATYETQEIKDVVVKKGQVTVLDATLKQAVKDIEAVEVVHTVRRDNEASMLLDRKKAEIVTDGLSAQAFRKAGDSDLSGAIKRVTGVSIQDGKYVFVRGLGDRYTQTTLNGLAVPGLDPDVNSIQLDIFPTSVLENVSVFKTASPELYGDFTGGIVNIVTKKFPTQKTTQIGFGLGFTPGMHFNKDFILYNKGKLDWLGFDDGSRKLGFNPRLQVPDETTGSQQLEDITRSFGTELAAKSKTALPNGSFSFNHGNQLNRAKDVTIGYNLVFNYSNENVFYKDFETSDYLKNTESNINDLFNIATRRGDVGKNTVMWSALATGSYKKGSNSYQLTLLNTQNSETTASIRTNEDFNQNQSTLWENVLTYSAKTLSTAMISGTHRFKKTDISWANAFSRSNVYDPDFRETRISITDGIVSMSTGNGSGIDRFWRELTEFNESFKLDFKTPIGKNIEMKYGVSGIIKSRDFAIYSFKHRRSNLSNIELDPDWFLQDDEIWSADPSSENYRNGTYTIGNYQPANTFSASQRTFGGYVGLFHPVLKVFKVSYGARVEKADMFYTGQNNQGSVIYNNERTLNELNILPSANINYVMTEKMNLRLGASRSVARPSFREKSISQIYDPLTKRTFNGNIDLQQTNINNFDVRYEFFISAKELFSISGFYKQFDGHIEMVSFASSPANITPRNSGNADLLGAELEFRKAITSKERSRFLNRIFLSANVSLVKSRVDLNSVYVDAAGQTEYQLREKNLRDGETLSNYRPMAGQSPYSINAGLSYEEPESELNISLNYNIQGEQLTVISSGRVPDVYTDPFHSLNLNAFRSFGKNKKSKLTLSVNNLLNDRVALVYKSYEAKSEVYSTYNPGIQFNFKYTYTF